MENVKDSRKLFGHELSPKADIEAIKEKLLSAYADEWIAGYYYMLTAEIIQGPNSGVIAEEFRKEAVEEITKHASEIAKRLNELGVDPPRDFTKLWSISSCKYPPIPDDPFDIDGFIIAAVKAEICAINAYKELFDLTHGVDPATEELAEDLLRDEVRHRTEMTNLLSKEGLARLVKELSGQH
ncbi:MAG: ferritin [Aeropyrum sp.]|nr:ferritin [Aeropyrum sp.]MCE4615445.1 ferritin [Aeropyrum sp.]